MLQHIEKLCTEYMKQQESTAFKSKAPLFKSL